MSIHDLIAEHSHCNEETNCEAVEEVYLLDGKDEDLGHAPVYFNYFLFSKVVGGLQGLETACKNEGQEDGLLEEEAADKEEHSIRGVVEEADSVCKSIAKAYYTQA